MLEAVGVSTTLGLGQPRAQVLGEILRPLAHARVLVAKWAKLSPKPLARFGLMSCLVPMSHGLNQSPLERRAG